MPNQFPLRTLLDLSHLRMDDAAKRLGQLLASEQEGAQRLALLVEYREEYQARFRDAAQDGMDPEQWRNFSAFLARLDEAVDQQRRIVEASRVRTADGQQAWLAERQKVKAYDTLSQRHHAAIARADERAAQKQSDEHSAKRFRERDDGVA